MNRTIEDLIRWNSKVKERQENVKESDRRKLIKAANTPRMSKGTKMMMYPHHCSYASKKKISPSEIVHDKLNEYLRERSLEPIGPNIIVPENVFVSNYYFKKLDSILIHKQSILSERSTPRSQRPRTEVKKLICENMIERNEQWIKNRINKINIMKQKKDLEMMNGCTFFPTFLTKRY